MNVTLISIYELGRQPFSLASPTAWLKKEGCEVRCLDLAVQPFDPEAVRSADLVAFSLPMHTATRLVGSAVEKVKEVNPDAHLCFYGLYAPLNQGYLRRLGAGTILGGEFEEGLVALVRRLSGKAGEDEDGAAPTISLNRQKFITPDRSGLPVLNNYAQLQVNADEVRTVGYTEATRGCKHRCRHCPVVPVYNGNFRIVQQDVVLEDIRRQVATGAQHITFGDPDFFNGPTHAVRLVEALHAEFPELTYDATIKVEHILKHRKHLPALRDTGCLFVTCAVESVDNRIVEIFEKNHTRDDFIEAVKLFRDVELRMNPTFVTFTPWTTIEGYLDLLHVLYELEIVDNVAPIQYAIRLLIMDKSRLLELPEVRDEIIGEFDEERLIYPWTHPDPRVDELYEKVMKEVQDGQSRDETRRQIFQRVWKIAHEACDEAVDLALYHQAMAPADQMPPQASIPYLTEPWYC